MPHLVVPFFWNDRVGMIHLCLNEEVPAGRVMIAVPFYEYSGGLRETALA